MTRREKLQKILQYLENLHDEELIQFVTDELKALDIKAEKAKANRAKNSAANDALSDAIANLIDDTPMTINEVVSALAMEYKDITNAKVSFRANALVADGILEKDSTVVDKRVLVTYKHI